MQGEVEFPVPPLAEQEAVDLFCARSQLESGDEIEELCRRLDNLPLAVELAAARTSVLTPEQILGRVADRLDLLRGGRDADARQQTLRATIEWSYELLTAEEQRLFARLSVFSGGCTLEAAEEVAAADVDTLQSLVEKSLVRHTSDRFWMLETIREFAAERLDETEDAGRVRRRHAEHFLALAESAHLNHYRPDHRPERVRTDLDNLRAALDWALGSDRALGFRIANALEMLWIYTNPAEGVRWYETLLDGAEGVPLELRARALLACGGAANPAGEDALAERMYEESHRLFEALGDDHGLAEVTIRLGTSAMYRGDLEHARELCTRGLELARAGGYQVAETIGLWAVGEAEWRLGNRDLRHGADRGERGPRRGNRVHVAANADAPPPRRLGARQR